MNRLFFALSSTMLFLHCSHADQRRSFAEEVRTVGDVLTLARRLEQDMNISNFSLAIIKPAGIETVNAGGFQEQVARGSIAILNPVNANSVIKSLKYSVPLRSSSMRFDDEESRLFSPYLRDGAFGLCSLRGVLEGGEIREFPVTYIVPVEWKDQFAKMLSGGNPLESLPADSPISLVFKSLKIQTTASPDTWTDLLSKADVYSKGAIVFQSLNVNPDIAQALATQLKGGASKEEIQGTSFGVVNFLSSGAISKPGVAARIRPLLVELIESSSNNPESLIDAKTLELLKRRL